MDRSVHFFFLGFIQFVVDDGDVTVEMGSQHSIQHLFVRKIDHLLEVTVHFKIELDLGWFRFEIPCPLTSVYAYNSRYVRIYYFQLSYHILLA